MKRIIKRSDDTMIIQKFFGMHWGLIILVTTLSMLGVAMLYSAAQGHMQPWAAAHGKRFLLGFIGMIAVALIDIRFWFRQSYLLYAVGVMFLILVEVKGFIGMGAQRWINIGGFIFQPSEMMKIVIALALARYFHNLHLNYIGKLHSLIIPALLIAIPVALILHQPNLGTASILAMMSVAVCFVAGLPLWLFLLAGGLGVAGLPMMWQFMQPYQKQRVMTFLNPEEDPLGSGYNIIQSKIALGSGGFSGKGFLHGSQSQLEFLPENETDFIFTMLAEEFGFVGGLFTLILYASILFIGIKIALNSKSHFGKLVSFGITTMLFLHLFINTAMAMGMIPVVGVPLPLLSYGGSNLLAMLIGFGFVLNAYVHREAKVERLGL